MGQEGPMRSHAIGRTTHLQHKQVKNLSEQNITPQNKLSEGQTYDLDSIQKQ